MVAINSILEELGNEVNLSIFTDDLALYITRNQNVGTRAQQGVINNLDTWALEKGLRQQTEVGRAKAKKVIKNIKFVAVKDWKALKRLYSAICKSHID